jgi:signal transduction histidine kinase
VARKSLQRPREMSTFTAPEKHPPSGLETSRTFAELTRRTLRLANRRGEAAIAAKVARARAEAIVKAGGDADDGLNLGAIVLVADALGSLAVEHGWPKAAIDELLDGVVELTGMPAALVRASVHMRAVRNPELLELSPRLAAETHLRMLVSLAGLGEASLWTTDSLGRVTCAIHIGSGEPTRRIRSTAREVLAETVMDRPGGLVRGLAVLRWQRPHAALVIRAPREGRDFALLLAEETAMALGPVFEREVLLERNAAKERALVEGSERRLTRLGFDLHDSPIQNIAYLTADLSLFRRQLAPFAAGLPEGPRLLGRLADINARLGRLDADLRELAQSLESATVAARPLEEVLDREIEAFRIDTEIEAELVRRGEFSSLSASQRIALARIVQEALSNIREHSGATRVSVSVAMRRNHVHAEIVDNGRGFAVERTLVRAAQTGRLGLLGMSERVRLLGGRFDIESQPGEGTEITVVLPPWQPLAHGGAGVDLPAVAGNRAT